MNRKLQFSGGCLDRRQLGKQLAWLHQAANAVETLLGDGHRFFANEPRNRFVACGSLGYLRRGQTAFGIELKMDPYFGMA